MRDQRQMIHTIRAIRDNGGLAVREAGVTPANFRAGDVALRIQAVADLHADGWLRPEGGNLRMTDFPLFAS